MHSKIIVSCLGICIASPALGASQNELDSLAAKMGVKVKILDNGQGKCGGSSAGCFVSELDLTMPKQVAPELENGAFKLYFSWVNPIIEADSELFTVRLINGDLNVIEPRANARLQAGRSYAIRLRSQGHFFSAYYPIPNMFLVSGTLQPRIIDSTRPATDPDSGLEVLPFVAPMTDEARLGTASPDDQTRWQTPERAFTVYADRRVQVPPAETGIIPTPAAVTRPAGAPINLSHGVRLQLSGVSRANIAAALHDLEVAGAPVVNSGPLIRIRVSKRRAVRPEGYRLSVKGARIGITAGDLAGVRYALESLAQETLHEHGQVKPLVVHDAPRFPYRGLHVDLARNFHSKLEVLKIIEQMGRYKLNKLHLHLGDDEGWRLEIAGLPELTELGAYRCFDPTETICLLPELGAGPSRNTPVNGYLTDSDYIEILKAAAARSIEVIPSFDMPGHSRAAIRSMELRYRRLMALGRPSEAEEFRLVDPSDTTQYRSVQNYDDNTLNVCRDATYRFVDKVIDAIAVLHRAAKIPLKTYHIGADETAGAWSGSPACKALIARTGVAMAGLGSMFIERVSNSIAQRGIAVAGWSDGLDHVDPKKMPAMVQSDIWGDLFTTATSEANHAANLGWKTVVAVPNVLYFDVPYAPNPLERGYDWPTRGTDTFKVFSFMPQNLAANASIMKDIKSRPTSVAQSESASAGRTIAGAQGNVWSETLRKDSLVDYMLFPRLLALAEREWHVASWEAPSRPGEAYSYGDGKVDQAALKSDWNQFGSKLGTQLKALESAGIMYRIAPPGARIVNGTLEANSELPGQAIEYQTANGPWLRYDHPVRVRGQVRLRTRSFAGSRKSRVVTVSSD